MTWQGAPSPTRASPAKHEPCSLGQPSTNPTLSARTPPSSSMVGADPAKTVFGTPFDRWRPIGGGADQDIFRRFKIRPAEEIEFLTYWAEKRLSTGFFARDSRGTLVFRISSAELTDLKQLDIGNPGSGNQSARWLHVYDQDGVSWLTQFRRMDLAGLPKIGGAAQPIGRFRPQDEVDVPQLASYL